MQSYCDFLSGTLHVRVNALLDSLYCTYNGNRCTECGKFVELYLGLGIENWFL